MYLDCVERKTKSVYGEHMRDEEAWAARVESCHEPVVNNFYLRAFSLGAMLQLFVLQLFQLGITPLRDGAGLGEDLEVRVVKRILALGQLIGEVNSEKQVTWQQ